VDAKNTGSVDSTLDSQVAFALYSGENKAEGRAEIRDPALIGTIIKAESRDALEANVPAGSVTHALLVFDLAISSLPEQLHILRKDQESEQSAFDLTTAAQAQATAVTLAASTETAVAAVQRTAEAKASETALAQRLADTYATSTAVAKAANATATAVQKQANVAATAEARSEIASGGLGLTRKAWERLHGPQEVGGTIMPLGLHYEGGKYGILFDGKDEQGPIFQIGVKYSRRVPCEQARSESKLLMPRDKKFLYTREIVDSMGDPTFYYDVYSSVSLAKLNYHPTILSDGTVLDLWYGGKPGTFNASFWCYASEGNTVSMFDIYLGKENP
jgi:hypothetical protein